MALALALATTDGVAAQPNPAECISAHADGQVLMKAGKLLAARSAFQSCSVATCPDVVQKDCLGFSLAVEQSLPTLQLSAKDHAGRAMPNVQIELDGLPVNPELSRQPIAVDPGEHRFRFIASDRASVEVAIQIRVGQKNRRVAVQFARPEPRSPRPGAAGLILAAVGAVGLASFVGFGLDGHSLERRLEQCAPWCKDRAMADQMRSRYLIADISLGVGLASLGAATYLLLTPARSSEPTSSSSGVAIELRSIADGGAILAQGNF